MIREFGQLSGFFTAPARGGDPSSLIVIMHGWGADASDLADLAYPISRSEERRVGKECRSRWSPDH